MVAGFWDPKDIVFIVYLRKVHNVNGEYYANLVKLLCKATKTKCPVKLSKWVLFHQDNAAARKFFVSTATLHDRGFEVVDYSSDSPILVQSSVPQ